MERDYGILELTGKEKGKLILLYLGICAMVSWLFYHSFWAVLPFLLGFPVFLKKQKACHWACLKKNIYIQYNMYNPFFFPLLPRSNPGLPFIHSISA